MNPIETDKQLVVCVLTPISAGAIAVVQIAGPGALQTAEMLFHPRSRKRLSEYEPGWLAYGDIRDAVGRVIDDGLAVRGGPTQRPWVQIYLHGSVRIVQRLIQAAEQLGAVFTPPCAQEVSNAGSAWSGPHDLSFEWLDSLDCWVQGCLCLAATECVVKWLSLQPSLWRNVCKRWRRWLARGRSEAVAAETEALLAKAPVTSQAWRGRSLAIMGLPNVGKSTIANRLSGRTASLVADSAGTTRDWVDRPAAVRGWPITLIDTAGLRNAADSLEAEGVSRAIAQAAKAHVRLIVLDSSVASSETEKRFIARIGIRSADILAYNKCDLRRRRTCDGREAAELPVRVARISALTGAGWQRLEEAIFQACGFATLQRQKAMVFCAELQKKIADLAEALRKRDTGEAMSIVESLAGCAANAADR